MKEKTIPALQLAGTLLIPFAKPFSNSPVLDLRGFALLGFVIVIGTFSAFGLFLKGMSTIGSMKASLLSTSEPVTATITSAVWRDAVFRDGHNRFCSDYRNDYCYKLIFEFFRVFLFLNNSQIRYESKPEYKMQNGEIQT